MWGVVTSLGQAYDGGRGLVRGGAECGRESGWSEVGLRRAVAALAPVAAERRFLFGASLAPLPAREPGFPASVQTPPGPLCLRAPRWPPGGRPGTCTPASALPEESPGAFRHRHSA